MEEEKGLRGVCFILLSFTSIFFFCFHLPFPCRSWPGRGWEGKMLRGGKDVKSVRFHHFSVTLILPVLAFYLCLVRGQEKDGS